MKFKELCKQRGITPGEIAQLLQISTSTAAAKIRGNRPFTLRQIKALCLEFSISAEEYFL